MSPRAAPLPFRAAETLAEYLGIFEAAQERRGRVLWYDVYRRAGNQCARARKMQISITL